MLINDSKGRERIIKSCCIVVNVVLLENAFCSYCHEANKAEGEASRGDWCLSAKSDNKRVNK